MLQIVIQIVLIAAPLIVILLTIFRKNIKTNITVMIVFAILEFIHIFISKKYITITLFELKINDISVIIDIIGIVITVFLAIIENRSQLSYFNQLNLSKPITQNESTVVKANIINSDFNYNKDNLYIKISKANIYIVLVKSLFEYEEVFNEFKSNKDYCRKIEINNISGNIIPIQIFNNRPMFSFSITDRDNLFSDILVNDAKEYCDKSMIVLDIQYKIYKKNAFNKLILHVYDKLGFKGKIKTKSYFFKLSEINTLNDEFVFEVFKPKRISTRSNINE